MAFFLHRNEKEIKFRFDVKFQAIDQIPAAVSAHSHIYISWSRGSKRSGKTKPSPVSSMRAAAWYNENATLNATLYQNVKTGEMAPKMMKFDVFEISSARSTKAILKKSIQLNLADYAKPGGQKHEWSLDVPGDHSTGRICLQIQLGSMELIPGAQQSDNSFSDNASEYSVAQSDYGTPVSSPQQQQQQQQQQEYARQEEISPISIKSERPSVPAPLPPMAIQPRTETSGQPSTSSQASGHSQRSAEQVVSSVSIMEKPKKKDEKKEISRTSLRSDPQGGVRTPVVNNLQEAMFVITQLEQEISEIRGDVSRLRRIDQRDAMRAVLQQCIYNLADITTEGCMQRWKTFERRDLIFISDMVDAICFRVSSSRNAGVVAYWLLVAAHLSSWLLAAYRPELEFGYNPPSQTADHASGETPSDVTAFGAADSDDSDPDNVPVNCTSCGRSYLDDASGVSLCVACRMRTVPSLSAHTGKPVQKSVTPVAQQPTVAYKPEPLAPVIRAGRGVFKHAGSEPSLPTITHSSTHSSSGGVDARKMQTNPVPMHITTPPSQQHTGEVDEEEASMNASVAALAPAMQVKPLTEKALLEHFQTNLSDNMTQIVLPEHKRVETEKERGLRGSCRFGQQQFDGAVQAAFRGYVRLVIRETESLIRPIFLDAIYKKERIQMFHDDADDLSTTKVEITGNLTIEDLTSIFDKALASCRRCYLPDLLIKQLFIQIFHTINALIFNGVARRLHDCNSGTGMKLKFRLTQLVDWLRKQMSLTGEPFLMVCEKQLAHSFQVANFLHIEKTMTEKELREEVCPSLNIFQLLHFVTIYKPDSEFPEPISDDLRDRLQELSVLEAEKTDSKNIMRLLLDPDFMSPVSVEGLPSCYMLTQQPAHNPRLPRTASAPEPQDIGFAWLKAPISLPESLRQRKILRFLETGKEPLIVDEDDRW